MMKKKTLITVLALVLVLAVAVGGAVAWLTATSGPVTNTFTVGDIKINLVEHAYNAANPSEITTNVSNSNNYKLIPGTTYAKDPTVTVEKNSEACYLFVKMEKANNPDTYLDYSFNSTGWTALAGHDGVYYRSVNASTADQSFKLLTDNKVVVKDTVTKDMVTATGFKQPTLTFTAAAIQSANIATVADAWSKLPTSFTGATTPTT